MTTVPGSVALLGVAYLALINALAWFLFWADKMLAIDRKRRVSEATLLTVMLIGGTAGAFAGRQVFRHKTRKQPFVRQMYLIASLQVAALIWVGLSGRF